MPLPKTKKVLLGMQGHIPLMSVEVFIDNALAYTRQRIFPKTLSIYNETGIRKADGLDAVVTQPMKEVVCVPVRPFDDHIIKEVGIDIPIALVRIIEPLQGGVRLIQYKSVVHTSQF